MAQDFAKLGAKVIMWDINEKCNKQTERLIREQGAKAYAYTVDVRYVCVWGGGRRIRRMLVCVLGGGGGWNLGLHLGKLVAP